MAQPTQRARTQSAKDQRRAALLDAALDEFFERGWAAARIEDIAGRAGLSKGTLYLYFNSKEALFASLVETVALPNIEQLRNIAESAPSIERLVRQLAAFAPTMVLQTKMPRLMKVLIGDSQSFPEVVTEYRENVLEALLSVFTGVLSAAHERGEIDIDDPALTARLMVSPVIFSAMWTVVFGREEKEPLDVEALLSQHAELFLRAIAPGASARERMQ